MVASMVLLVNPGEFEFLYCSNLSCYYDGYEQWKQSNLYFSRSLSYLLEGSASLGAELPGLEVESGLTVSIEDLEVFDDVAPVVKMPSLSDFDGLIQFSPANAVALLRLIDSSLIQASSNGKCNAAV